MKRQPGDVHPSEYDWKDQFDVRGMGYIKFDAGKVRGLAQYAEELEARVAELEEVARLAEVVINTCGEYTGLTFPSFALRLRVALAALENKT